MTHLNRSSDTKGPPSVVTGRVVSLLRQELALALELNTHLQQASEVLRDRAHPNIASLPRNLLRDLVAKELMLAQRLETLAPSSVKVPSGPTAQQGFWALFPEDGRDPRAHLEALVAGYARFVRSTSDITADVRTLADLESVQILKEIAAICSRGLWFLEIYLEGLALHMDPGRLPNWPGSAGCA